MDDNSSLMLVVVVLPMLLWIHRARASLLLSQQGFELSTLLVLTLAVCPSVGYHLTKM